MSKMHEYEMQSFSKTQVLNPVFPKLRFSNILHKFSSIKYVLHKNSKYLQAWLIKPKTHTITCTMFSKVVCETSKNLRYMWGDMWIAIKHKVYKIHHIEFERDWHLKSYII